MYNKIEYNTKIKNRKIEYVLFDTLFLLIIFNG